MEREGRLKNRKIKEIKDEEKIGMKFIEIVEKKKKKRKREGREKWRE